MSNTVHKWEYLINIKTDIATELINHQNLLTELIKGSLETINQDKNLVNMVRGLMNTYSDIGTEIANTMSEHIIDRTDDVINYRQGPVDENSEDYYNYIQIQSKYIAIGEKLAHIASTAYMDIFTLLKAPVDKINELNKAYTTGLKDMDKVSAKAFNKVKKLKEGTKPSPKSTRSNRRGVK